MNKRNEITNGISVVVNGILMFGNEHLQRLAMQGDREYSPFMGYVSDITYPAALTSFFYCI